MPSTQKGRRAELVDVLRLPLKASGGHDRHLYILYGAEHAGHWADGHVHKWYVHDYGNLGSAGASGGSR